MFYSGIDLHKNNCYITTINRDGTIIKQSKLPNEEHAILNYFFSVGNIHKAVVESTSNWYWLSDLLKNHQIDLTLAHAKYLKAISYAKVKTDKVDSQTLAQLLRMNLIPTAHQISPDIRGIRDTMRARLRLVQKKTSSILSIHRILEKFNVPIPEYRKLNLFQLYSISKICPYLMSISFRLIVAVIRSAYYINRLNYWKNRFIHNSYPIKMFKDYYGYLESGKYLLSLFIWKWMELSDSRM